MKKLYFLLITIFAIASLSTACDKKDSSTTSTASTPTPARAEAAPSVPEAEQATEDEADGQWVVSRLYGVKFLVPEDWQIDAGEEGVSATAADGTTTVILVGSESENMVQAAINDLKSNIELKDVRFEKSGLTTINGLAGTRGSGAAVLVKDDGDQEIQFLAYSLRVGRNTVTMMIFSQAEMYEAQRDMIQGIAQTITRT